MSIEMPEVWTPLQVLELKIVEQKNKLTEAKVMERLLQRQALGGKEIALKAVGMAQQQIRTLAKSIEEMEILHKDMVDEEARAKV
jgi:hypothetical protein